MQFEPESGLKFDGNLYNNKAITKRNLSNSLNSGYKNVLHYSDSNITDGVRDSRAAIVAADAIGPVFFPPGVYAIASNLTFTNKPTFAPGARIKPSTGVIITLSEGFHATDTQYIFDTSASGSSIIVAKADHLTADNFGATPASSTNLVFFQRALASAISSGISLVVPPDEYTFEGTWGINADNVEIFGSDGRKSILHFNAGYLGFSDCDSPKVDNLTITGSDHDSDGVYFFNGTVNASITNCTIKGFGDDPGGQHGAILFELVNGCTAIGNVLEDNNGNSTCADIIFTTCKDIVCIGNRCVSPNGGGISIDNNPNDLDIRFIVSNNIIKGKSKHGLIIGYGADINRGSITGNVIYDCSVTGMYIQGGSGDSSGEVVITGNMISYCGGSQPVDDAGNCGVFISGNSGTFTGNYISDSGYDTSDLPRGTGLGRSILFGHCKHWTITGNTFRNSANISLDFLSQNTAKNILIANNIILDGGTRLIQVANSTAGATKNFTITGNIFERLNTDGTAISILDIGGQGMELLITNNEFRGIRDDADSAAILWIRENYGRTTITGNTFRNWDRGLDSTYLAGNTNVDWGFGEAVYVDDNLFDTVDIPFNLRTDIYNAVGRSNRFISCSPGYNTAIVPANIVNGILDGYYVDSLPARRCRPGDRLKLLKPNATNSVEYFNTASLPSVSAFTVSSGNIFNHTSHGLRVYDRIKFTSGSIPTPLEIGVDYYVATVPDANTFTISKYFSWDTLTLTSTGSGNYQKQQVSPTWLADTSGLNRANHTGVQQSTTISDFKGTVLNSLGTTTYSQLLGSATSLLNGDSNLDGTGDANDTIGAYNGTWGGSANYGLSPIHTGKSFILDGSNYITQISEAGDFNNNTTIAAWVKRASSSEAGRIASKRTDSNNAWELYINTDGSVSLYDSAANIFSTSAGVIGNNTWHHVAVVINGASSRFYIDGVASGSTFNPTISSLNTPVNWGRLGAFGGLDYLTGELYQCAIWIGTILTSDQIALLSNPNLTNLLAVRGTGYSNVLNYTNEDVSNGITDARSAIAAADAVGPVFFPPGIYVINSNITLANKPTFAPGARIKPDSSVVVTLSKGFVSDEDQYVFDITAGGSVSVVTRRAVTPDNFGAARDGVTDDSAAVTAALEAGDSNHINVKFLTGAYVCSSVADMSAGNMRVKVVGENAALIPASTNTFALRFFGLPPIGPMEISGLAFWGIDRTKDGLEIACVTSAKIENCVFTNCGIGLLINGTIDSTYDNLKIDGCYVGIHMTVRNGIDHPTAIYNVNGRTVTTSASNYAGQPTEQLFNRIDIKHCAIGIVVDQKGSPYARQQCLLMNKVVMHEVVVGYVQKGDEIQLGNNGNQWVTFQNPWLENIGTTALVHTNQGGPYGNIITYDGDTQEYCGFSNLGGYLCVRNGGAARLYAANRSFTYLDCSDCDVNSYIGPNATVVEHNGLGRNDYKPVYSDYTTPYNTTNNAGGTLASSYCLPFSGQVSLEHAESGSLLYSKTQFIGDQTINSTGETFQVADGVLDRKESLGHILRQSTGPWVNGITSQQNQLYVMKYSVRAYSPAYTFTASGATITATGHDLINGQEVQLTTIGTLPTGLSLNTSYYIVGVSGDTFGLSVTAGGSAITTTGSGSGTHTIKQKNGFVIYNANLANGFIFRGWPLITDRWETYFAVGMAESLGSAGDILMISGVANVVRKIVLGPIFIMKVNNESEAMRICRSQAFYATQYPAPLINRKEKAESVASSATPTLDYSDSDGDTKTSLLNNVTAPTITMARPGRHDWVVTQDATGSREILWPTNMRFRYMAPQPDLTPGKKSLLSWVYDGTHGVADGVQHSNNYIADFDAVGAIGSSVSIPFPDAGTILVKCRLAVATPVAKTRLFQTKVTSPDSHYPYTDGDIYCDWLRSTRIESITPSGSVNRTLWHWVIVQTDSTDGWNLIQSLDGSTLYTIHSATHETIGTLNFVLAPVNCQAEIDRVLIFNSRLGASGIGNATATTKTTPNSDMPSGMLARYELNNDRGGKLIQDWSGNGRDITLTDATPSLFVVNSGTNS
jgi:hypothetical protein